MKKITKAVIPAAGFGTRFLPQTKAMPKEMLPIVDKPVIQYIVEELIDAGIEDIIIVTGYHKRTIEDHFDTPNADLINNLKLGGPKKMHLIEQMEKISNMANFYYVRQKGPYGNGTPILNAAEILGDEPFLYTWCDDMIVAEPKSEFMQLIEAYNEYGCSVLASVRAKSDDDYTRYGFAAGSELKDGLLDVKSIIEKPGKTNAPSDLANVSSYIFTPDIVKYLKRAQETMSEGNELYYNDALKLMLADKKRVIACEIKNGKYYDTGNKLEYLKTVVDFALKHEEVKEEFTQYLKTLKVS